MRIAFFGGSFDPPHLGHLAIAHAALAALRLDRVLFVPVGNQPLKPDGATASFADRVAMVTLAIEGEPAFEILLADTPRETPNYTIDSLAILRDSLPPEAEIFLLIGADALRSLSHWHRAAEIPFAAQLIVASRPAEDLSDLPALMPAGVAVEATDDPHRFRLINSQGDISSLTILPDLNYEISATQIRDQVHELSTDSTPLLAPSVFRFIREHHLYE